MAPEGAILKGYVFATMNVAQGEHILSDHLRMYIWYQRID